MARGLAVEQLPTSAVREASPAAPARDRIDAIDRLRGIVMVLMALDHIRGYFGPTVEPTDLSRTTAALFLSRWISHLCAPTFIFLAGTGAYLSARRGLGKPALSWFLVTRGLWIVFLGLTVVKFAWGFTIDLEWYNADVLWAIGWSMVVLGGLVFLPTWAVLAFGLVLIAGHNLLDPIRPAEVGPFAGIWTILHGGGKELELFGGRIRFNTQYPLVPWIGVMAVGYGFGALFTQPPTVRRRWLLGLGAALCLGFLLLRASNRYGDPDPWSERQTPLFTALSFLNCHKYPPSLLFLMMTLGPAFLLLAGLETAPHMLGRPLLTFGRVPMFFYLIHLPLIHALQRCGRAFLSAEWQPPGYGLPLVYAIWLGVLLLLYPPCRWFAGVKQRHRTAWLSYL
jgi:uncharacterized membrane protein